MKSQKFEEFAATFDLATSKFPILLVEQITSSESEDKVFKTVPSTRASISVVSQGRKLGAKPMENAFVFDFRYFEKAARVGISAGRADMNKVCLPDNAVSKMHASFKWNAQGKWELVDVDSTNSTRVNGKQVAANKSTVLQNGDGITFADTYHCTFFLPDGFKAYLQSLSR
jgi:hypothetical protein